MSTYFAPPTVVNPEIDYTAELEQNLAKLDTAYKTLADELSGLVNRMYAAMDEIAEAAGAWHCDYCGEWTTETIDVANYSDELGYEMQSHCRRCVPAGVEVN
jgi:hypothetical protein